MGKNDEFEETSAPAKLVKPAIIDEDAPILSAVEIADIKARAKQNILKAKKKDAEAALLEQETQRLRIEEGFTTGNSHLDEIVNITIDLAQFAPSILINNQPYHHGRNYSVPRHVADTLREVMFRTWGHQADIDGKSKSAFYAEKHVAELFKPSTKGAVVSARGV